VLTRFIADSFDDRGLVWMLGLAGSGLIEPKSCEMTKREEVRELRCSISSS
jgi:hypothetical protein